MDFDPLLRISAQAAYPETGALPYNLPNIDVGLAESVRRQIREARPDALYLLAGTLAFSDADPSDPAHRLADYHTKVGLQNGRKALQETWELVASSEHPRQRVVDEIGIPALRKTIAHSVAGLGGQVVDQEGGYGSWAGVASLDLSRENAHNVVDEVGIAIDWVFGRSYVLHNMPHRKDYMDMTVLQNVVRDDPSAPLWETTPQDIEEYKAGFRPLYNLFESEETLTILEQHERQSYDVPPEHLGLRRFWRSQGLSLPPESGGSRILIAEVLNQFAGKLGGVIVPRPEAGQAAVARGEA